MDFIVDNYVWFIIGAIVILMAIVGYIADITDFGRKSVEKKVKVQKEKVKKEQTKKEKVKKEKVVEELPTEQSEAETIKDESNNINQTIENETVNGELQDGLSQFTQDNSIENSLFTEEVNGEVESNEEVDQSLFEPLPSIDQVFQDTNNDESNIDNSSINATMPEENQTSDIESDDDIWKF